jgi:hypothetical protein
LACSPEPRFFYHRPSLPPRVSPFSLMFAARTVASMITSSGKVIEIHGQKYCVTCKQIRDHRPLCVWGSNSIQTLESQTRIRFHPDSRQESTPKWEERRQWSARTTSCSPGNIHRAYISNKTVIPTGSQEQSHTPGSNQQPQLATLVLE